MTVAKKKTKTKKHHYKLGERERLQRKKLYFKAALLAPYLLFSNKAVPHFYFACGPRKSRL